MSQPEIYDKISVNVPHSLLEKIDEAAQAERRNRTSWLVYHLEKLIEGSSVQESIPAKSVKTETSVKYPKGRKT